MRILITGGAGFIGSHLTDVFLRRGHEVRCLDDLSMGRRENIEHNLADPAFEFLEGDVRDGGAMMSAAEGVDAIVHLAAGKIPRYTSAYSTLMVNVFGGHAALEAAREHKAKIVMASTSDVYGTGPDLPFRESGPLVLGSSTSRRWAYAVSKLCDEHLAFAYEDEFGVDISIVRFFGAYGERQYPSWWGGPQGVFLEAISRGEPVEIHGDGMQTRCFIHVDDLVEATARVAESEAATGQIINIGAEEEISIVDLARLMHELSGSERELELKFVPYESLSKNYQDVQRRVPDLTKMQELLDYTPQISLREGLRRLWEWYRTAGATQPRPETVS